MQWRCLLNCKSKESVPSLTEFHLKSVDDPCCPPSHSIPLLVAPSRRCRRCMGSFPPVIGSHHCQISRRRRVVRERERRPTRRRFVIVAKVVVCQRCEYRHPVGLPRRLLVFPLLPREPRPPPALILIVAFAPRAAVVVLILAPQSRGARISLAPPLPPRCHHHRGSAASFIVVPR